MIRVAVVGANGFVGRAVCTSLRKRGYTAVPIRAPRLSDDPSPEQLSVTVDYLRDGLGACGAVINCAGKPDATSSDLSALMGANAVLPGIISEVASSLGLRFVHVSSAAVQGRRPVLDSSAETDPFSPYSASKARGEEAALRFPNAIVYRPPGVHGAERPVTAALAKVARSPLACVAGDGSRNTAQALIENVGDAVAFLATCSESPPRVVHHPSEGITVAALLSDLGGKAPVRLPSFVASAVVDLTYQASKIRPGLQGIARRLETMWFGQEQAPSWLMEAGWTPPRGRPEWQRIGSVLAKRSLRA